MFGGLYRSSRTHRLGLQYFLFFGVLVVRSVEWVTNAAEAAAFHDALTCHGWIDQQAAQTRRATAAPPQ